MHIGPTLYIFLMFDNVTYILSVLVSCISYSIFFRFLFLANKSRIVIDVWAGALSWCRRNFATYLCLTVASVQEALMFTNCSLISRERWVEHLFIFGGKGSGENRRSFVYFSRHSSDFLPTTQCCDALSSRQSFDTVTLWHESKKRELCNWVSVSTDISHEPIADKFTNILCMYPSYLFTCIHNYIHNRRPRSRLAVAKVKSNCIWVSCLIVKILVSKLISSFFAVNIDRLHSQFWFK